MKKFTQEEFDNMPIDRYGIKQCPSGDYTAIHVFGNRCSFGKWCSFGDVCSFGKWCSFSKGCSFGEDCSFGGGCSFGEWCFFGEGCKYLDFTFQSVICLFGLIKYPIYIYRNKKDYIISVGCENFDSLDKAVTKSKEEDCYDKKAHKMLKILLD